MRCKGCLCPLDGAVSSFLYRNGLTRCWCCFNSCFRFVSSYLVDLSATKSYEANAQIEEWFRGYNCWPLPLVTIVFCTWEIYYYFLLASQSDVYNNLLLQSPFIWKPESRDELWRWFSYSLCHGSATHLGMNAALQVLLGIFIEFEHKVNLMRYCSYGNHFLSGCERGLSISSVS